MRTKLETLVGIKFEIEGMHCYPNASANHGDGVKFLEQPHRHLFKFNCKKRVNHDNRDEEFILLKNRVESYIKHNTPIIAGTAIYDFGSQSCEQIAKKVLKQFDFEEVEVSEDGENYAVVKKVLDDKDEESNPSDQEQKIDPFKDVKITFVVGGCCSGKTYFIEKLLPDAPVIEVGEIVRNLTKKQERVFNKFLDQDIVKEIRLLIYRFASMGHKKIIVVGCRQTSIFKAITDNLDKGKYQVILLSVPYLVRQNRFENRSLLTEKDQNKSFEDVLSGEKSIGFDDFIEYLINEEYDNLTIIKNVEE